MLVLNGENCVMGRLAAKVAKEALKGETVRIYNAEKIIITGDPVTTFKRYKQMVDRHNLGKPSKSPKVPRRPDLFVKRVIRGMVPRKSKRGAEALRRVRVHMEVPEEFSGKGTKYAEMKNRGVKKITVGKLCKDLGWRG